MTAIAEIVRNPVVEALIMIVPNIVTTVMIVVATVAKVVVTTVVTTAVTTPLEPVMPALATTLAVAMPASVWNQTQVVIPRRRRQPLSLLLHHRPKRHCTVHMRAAKQ